MSDDKSNDNPNFIQLNPILSENLHDNYNSLDDSKLPLSQLIPKIILQRGSFVNLTEEDLLREIEEHERQNEQHANGWDSPSMNFDNPEIMDETSNNINSMKSKDQNSQSNFFQQKEAAIDSIHSALNESSLSLDFVSLLLSSVRPTIASTSMSPHLKQHVKLGSLSNDRVHGVKNGVRQEQQIDKDKVSRIGRGWKLESLEKSSTSLRNASARLSEEILKERRFWNEMIDVVNSNEILVKISTKSFQEIGVKYGFGDCGSNYHDKGVGLLKKNKVTGELYFERLNSIPSTTNQPNDNLPKVLKVKLYSKSKNEDTIDNQQQQQKQHYTRNHNNSNGNNSGNGGKLVLLGETDIKEKVKKFKKKYNEEKSDIVLQISKARFFLFEEELFYQLLKEATTLISLQVSIESNRIIIDLYDYVIELEAVPVPNDDNEDDFEENVNEDEKFNVSDKMDESDEPKSNHWDSLACQIALFLRIMLCYEYKKNLSSKSFTPYASLPNNQRMAMNSNSGSGMGSSGSSSGISTGGLSASGMAPLLLKPLIIYSRHNHFLKQIEEVLYSVFLTYFNDSKEKTESFIKDPKSYRLSKFLNDPNNIKTQKSPSAELIKNPFMRYITSPSSSYKILIKIRDNLYLKCLVALSSPPDSVYSNINVNIVKLKLSDEELSRFSSSESQGDLTAEYLFENIPNSESLLNVSFTDIRDLEDCLRWSLPHYTSELSQ
ncbi:hypothetical protein B5S33_g1459 [[Candida] boidinii]|nr:hypothetical protein B5S30_g348 [[Candida] boidinii]OWB82831.1 hypothetical protein B5S33_g1459 [[Candida] boidinii]